MRARMLVDGQFQALATLAFRGGVTVSPMQLFTFGPEDAWVNREHLLQAARIRRLELGDEVEIRPEDADALVTAGAVELIEEAD